ncbi:hypothetical protein CLI64_20680 [Nostoc sp. CENA543]|uniref:hypothetical protein n=1 Tax=Nostoc sp. CENA543 TaxID=1869241 RepID=UPI000CA16DB5|nr:hypothetical protein [Nostoc sp. CENA543]AUT02611.1 hypothetical protein CLI64_20680 [Nostoc sp. CENA543]
MKKYSQKLLLVTGMLCSFSLSPLSVQAQQQTQNPQISAMVEALRLAAPQTGTANDALYTDWQIKPETLKAWSRNCLKREVKPAQFENDPKLTRQVVSCIISRELTQQFRATNNETAAVRNAACWWMTGKYTGCNSGFTGSYVQKVVAFYQKERARQ